MKILKVKLLIIVVFGYVLSGFAQNQNERDYGYYESLNLGVGYSYSFGEPNEKNFHLLDIGIHKMMYGGRHGGGFQYGMGTEIGLNTESFIIGPKISAALYYQIIVFGTELITYTDFDHWTLRFVPFIGIGGEKFKLTIHPQIILSNKDFQPVNRGLVNLTVHFNLDRKRR